MSKITAFLPLGNFTLPERISCFFTLGDLKISFKMSLPTFRKVLTSFVFLCTFVVKADPLEKVNAGESWILELPIPELDLSLPSVRSGLGFSEVFSSIADSEPFFGCNVGFLFRLGINLITRCIVGKLGEEERVLCTFSDRGR